MRKAKVLVNGIDAGILEETDNGLYQFTYHHQYNNAPVSLTMPLGTGIYEFEQFPSFFEGLLPEGVMLDGLLRKHKLDKNDLFGQLVQVGHDLVGAVTIEALK
ncbi:MAG: HipA N-terminal domain-containing protein [Sphingobacteriales bacterium]